MIISPPFIPAPIAGETDEAFVERAMPGGQPGDGAFPLSFDLNWHGGMHLSAPRENGQPLPVRAIADGKLVYFRAPTAKTNDEFHALKYRTPQSVDDGWTDNGCLVLRHETEIGEGERGQVVFFSIYMHLSKINIANPQINQRIYRKDSIGEAGQIYGSAGKIHFEIIADDSQIAHLTGRQQRDLDYQAQDGRTDSCWGDMYFFVPAPVQGYASPPNNFAQPTNPSALSFQSPSYPPGWYDANGKFTSLAIVTSQIDGYRPDVVGEMNKGLIVRMRYERGQCQLTTYFLGGELIGTQQEETDFEYNLYTTATRRYPGCPSAGYELLRFGRVLGPDALQPASAAHWRKISLPPRTEAGETERNAWFNLNAPGITRFSDADFPHWMGWRLIDDDQDSDSHCQSDYIRREILEPPSIYAKQLPRREDAVSRAQSSAYDTMFEGDKRRLSEQYMDDRLRNTTYLVEANARGTLKRLICKFPTEWARDDFEVRYGWLKRVADGGPMPEGEFQKLEKHHQALAFWEEAGLEGIESKHWHFPPKDILLMLRSCHWLSVDELAQCIPRRNLHLQGAQFSTQTIATWNVAYQRATTWAKHLNRSMRKYCISNTAQRINHFLAQLTEESGYYRLVKEGNGENAYYAPYYGRGLIQLTHKENYEKFGSFRKFPTTNPSQSLIFPGLGWNPNTLIAENNQSFNPANCADSAGFYWTCPAITATSKNALDVSDTGLALDQIVSASRTTNGNVPIQNINGLSTRIQTFIYLKHILLEDIPTSESESISFTWRRNAAQEPLFHPNGQPILKPNGQQKFGYISTTHSIQVSLQRQRP